VVLESVGKLRFLARILPKVFSGTHVHEPCVSVFRASEVSIRADRPFTVYADGDPIGELPVRVRAVRGAVTMLTPAVGPADPAFVGPYPLSTTVDPVESAARAVPSAGGSPADR